MHPVYKRGNLTTEPAEISWAITKIPCNWANIKIPFFITVKKSFSR